MEEKDLLKEQMNERNTEKKKVKSRKGKCRRTGSGKERTRNTWIL